MAHIMFLLIRICLVAMLKKYKEISENNSKIFYFPQISQISFNI